MRHRAFLRLAAAAAASIALPVVMATPPRHRRQVGATGCDAATFAYVLPNNARVERVELVEAGSTYGDGLLDLSYPLQPTNLPELCAVTIEVTSSLISSHRFGVFLPAEWNNRFLAVGNGGFGGGINWLDMGAGVRYNFTVVSTDTGHNSTPTDISWALGNAETKTDWGWRAMHSAVALGKQLAQAYYARPVLYSYYSGCSTGGRQGLKEVQTSPQSFDGVLVGAPAWYTSHLNPWISKVATYNWPLDDPKHIDPELLAPLASEIVRQCDGADGVADGIVSLPQRCAVDYAALSCSRAGAGAPSACLSDAQLGTLQNVYGDYVSAAGEELYPGLLPGSERQMSAVLGYAESSPYGIGYQRYFLFDDPGLTLADFNDGVVALADALDPGNATARDYDLAAFRDRGGRLLMYHGMADGLVPTKGSDLYYDGVTGTMGGGVAATREFFRYFMVPGMQHCWTTVTDAPWAFGGASQAAALGNDTWSVPGFKDAQHDALLALMDWVEKDIAVDQIIATTWGEPTNTSSGVLRQRPLCPYPQMAIWDETGNIDDAGSWSCGGDINASVENMGAISAPLWNPFTTMASMLLALFI